MEAENGNHLNKRLTAEVPSAGDHPTPRSCIDRWVHAFSTRDRLLPQTVLWSRKK